MTAWLTRFSIRTRAVLVVVIGLAIILAVAGYLSAQALRESAARVFDERLRLAQVAAQHVDDHVLQEVLVLLERAAASEGFDLTDADREPERHALRNLYAAGLFTYNVFVTDRQGRMLWMEPPAPTMTGVDLSAEPEVRQALQMGQPQVGSLVRFHETEKAKVTFVVPVKGPSGVVAGLIGGAADPTSPSFAGIIAALRPAGAGYVDVVDQNGMVLASTTPAHMLKESDHRHAFLPLLRERRAAVGVYPVVEEGVEKGRDVVAFAPLSAARWAVSIEQPEAEALAPVYALRRRVILAGAAALLVTILLTWLATQSVLDPLKQLLAASRRVASGDLATPVPPLGRDEIGELGRAFEEMRQRLAAWGEELETAVRERTRELSVLYTIDRVAAQSLDLEEILGDSLDKVLEVLEIEAGGILLLEPDGGTLTLRVYRGLSDEFVRAVQRIKVGEGISGRAIAEGRPVVLDVPDYPTERLVPFVAKEGFKSLASTPLISKGRALGVLNLGTRRSRAFPPEEMELLVAIGQQLGSAVDNAHLFEAERRRAAQLTLVAGIARRAVSILDPDQLLQETANAIQQAFGYYDVVLFLVDQEAGELILKARAGSFERPFPQEGPVWKIGDAGIIDWMARHGQTLVANDVGREPHYRAFLPGTRSELCVPITDGGRVVAGINVESDRLYAFDEADVAALEALADELAVALRNAQLFEETRQKSEHLAVINRLDRVISSGLDIQEVYEAFVEEVARLVSFDRTAIVVLDEGREQWEVLAQWTRAKPVIRPGARGAVKGTALEWVLKHRRPWLEGELGEKGKWPGDKMLRREGVRSGVLLPLIARDRVQGLLTFGSYRPHIYSERALEVLLPIADQMAIALENSRLYQAMKQRLADLSALFKVSGALRNAATVEEMLPVILDKTLEVVAAEAGAIFLVNQAARQVVVPVARGPMEEMLVGRSFPLTGSVAETMLHTEERDISLDLAADPRMPAEMRTMLRGGESGIGLPLRAAGVPVGMMVVSWLAPHAVSDDELHLLTAIADMAASAVHRAGLHDQTARQARELARLVAELEETYDATLAALSAALDARDHETEGHSRRVAQLAMTIARTMGLPDSEIEALMRGALLHDIGKIGVPDSILRKPGSLTDEERAQMQRHNQIGYDMLKDIRFLALALPVVLCHHERWDGMGYPQGLRGEAIPLAARIFAVADAYDAMTSNRPYRRGMSHAEAIAEIQREAGKQFDPQVVEVFLAGFGFAS